jgi:iron complex transport system substrate-binding protein
VQRGKVSGLFLVGFVTAVALWAAWRLNSSPMGAVPQGSSIQGDGFPKVLIDQSGRQVVLSHRPTRIASVTLATDEILLALVEPSRVLAVTYLAVDERVSNVPDQAAAIPHKIRADAEQIIALQPDLVFVASYLRGEVVKLLQDAGLAVFQFREFDSIAAIQGNIRLVARAVGEETRAETVIAEMNARLQAVAARRPQDAPRPRVLYWGARGQTAGIGTSVHDLITHAGGENLAAAQGIAGIATLSTEQVLALNPEVIFSGGDQRTSQPGLPAFLLHPALHTVDALQRQRVFTLPQRYLTTISQHIIEGVEALAHFLHAETTGQRGAL